jgi:membrane-associated phospholipid phosphatase
VTGSFACAVAVALAVAAPATDPPRASQDAAPGGLRRFAADVLRDYRNMLSMDNVPWAIAGATVATSFQAADEPLREVTAQPTPRALKPGGTYGNLAFQVPLAATWWIVGHAADSARGAAAGRDLLRAQLSAMSWTYAIKYAVRRTRPNGDPRSFPSGHTSASFATATVLQQHYGWKFAAPIYGLAAYTAAERVMDEKHWASDVAFGAVVGMLSGRTVTRHLRGGGRVTLGARALPGGGEVVLHVVR